MGRSRLIWELFVTFGLLLLLAIASLSFLVANQLEHTELGELEERLRGNSIMIAEIIRRSPELPDAELLRRLSNISSDLPTRITFIAKDGQVLAETAKDPAELDNHADRPEFIQALTEGWGKSVRKSPTVGVDMMYVALRTDQADSPVAVVRLAFPLSGILAKITSLQNLIWLGAGLTGLLTLGIAYWLARRFIRRLRELIDGAEQIARGAYGHHVYAEGRDEIGQLARTFNNMSDRLAEQFNQLDEDRHKLRTVLSGMVEGVVAIDAKQNVLFANDRAGQLFGFDVLAARGRKLWEVIRQRPLQEVVVRALADREAHCEEKLWTGPTARNLSVNVACLPGEPPQGAVIVLHDTTELRRLERLRQEFVANVSHELKTPLSVIKANIETLLGGAVADPVHCGIFLERISEQADRLHALIIDLLSLARIESGTEVFQYEEVALGEVVRACVEHHLPRAEGKQLQLHAVPPAGQDGVVAWADPEAVQQILDNLVDNAVKYTPAGGRISVAWRGEQDRVCLQVEDTGIGIPEADLPRIFERFFRVDKARSRELGGTGLGLSIVKHLVQALHGSVSASSQPRQGTTFIVRLPRAPEF